MMTLPLAICSDLNAGTTGITAESGTGTVDDPFVGSVFITTIQGITESDLYFATGCDVTIQMDDVMGSGPTITPSTGFSISYLRFQYTITGTSSSVGDYTVYLPPVKIGSGDTTVLHFVEVVSYVDLEFLSDPVTDGTITYTN